MRPRLHLAPDLVIIARVALAFVTLGLFAAPHPVAAAGLVMIVVVIAMDGLDGWLARKLGVDDDLGAILDITGDRIVEHVYWIYFAVAGVSPLWAPLVVVTRSFAVDTVRGLALTRGKTPFGKDTMMRSPVTEFLVASRFMRNFYGVAKVAVFVVLGGVIVAERAAAAGVGLDEAQTAMLEGTAFALVVLTVALNVIRGVPVLWDSVPYLERGRATGEG